MGFYNLKLDALSEYTGRTVEDLKKETYEHLESMIKDMERDKFMERNNRNANDAEYERLVLKYFKPVPFLRHWFDDREIVFACAHTGVETHNICEEHLVSPGRRCVYQNAEYLRTSFESVRQYDKQGRELMHSKRQEMDVYRIANHYQGLQHAKPIKHLVYSRYPELSQFGFEAYELYDYQNYEIYPANNIYIPFAAMMTGNVDAVLHRNREYCKWYNNGRYSPAECEKAFATEDAQKMFDIIRQVGEKERAMGHFGMTVEDGRETATADGLTPVCTSAAGTFTMFMEKANEHNPAQLRQFILNCHGPGTVEQLITEFCKMHKELFAADGNPRVDIHICDTRDYLREHAVEVKFSGCMEYVSLDNHTRFDCSKYPVISTFGVLNGHDADLVIRINCEQIRK